MFDSISASSLSGLFGSLSSSAPTSTAGEFALPGAISSTVSTFGPDFFMDALGSRNTPGAAYGLTGQSITPTANTKAGKERTAALDKARRELFLGNTANSREAAQTILKRDAADATALYYVGQSYLKEGDYRQAEAYFSRSVQSAADEKVQFDLTAAQTLEHGKDATLEQVRQMLRQPATESNGVKLAQYYLDNNKSDVDFNLVLASYFEKKQDFDTVGTQLRDAIHNVPAEATGPLLEFLKGFAERHDNVSSYDLLGQAYVAAGKFDDARDTFEKALTFDIEDFALKATIRNDLADVYTKIGQQKLEGHNTDAAEKAFNEALKLNRNDEHRKNISDLQYDEGLKALRGGRFSTAITDLNNSRINLPLKGSEDREDKLLDIFDDLADKLTAAGNLRDVIRARGAAYGVDDSTTRKRALADAYDAYGQELLTTGKYADAFKNFRSATGLFDDDTNYLAHRNLAKSYLT